MKKLNLTLVFIQIFTIFFTSCQEKTNPHVIMKTDFGNIVIELYIKRAPVSCSNFLEYTDKKLWKGASFYRVVKPENQPGNKIKIEVIQGGLYLDDNEYLLPPIKHETTSASGILHKNGIISWARNEPGSASSEFFICLGDQPELDFGGRRNPDGQGFAAFGKVIQGMEIVKKIQQIPDSNQFLIHHVAIESIERLY